MVLYAFSLLFSTIRIKVKLASTAPRVADLLLDSLPLKLVSAVFSLSFLPWLLFLLGIILSVPITAFMDAARRRKAIEAVNPSTDEQGEASADDEVVGEEVVAEEVEVADGGFGEDTFGGGDFGENAPNRAFDDDPFK